jgi:hypothetical protein
MSDTTTTPNYGLIKPNVNADNDLWGDHWNLNADTLDSVVHGIDTKTTNAPFLPIAGGTLTGNLSLPYGTLPAPALAIGPADGTGFSRAVNTITLSVQGTLVASLFSNAVQLNQTLFMLSNRIQQVADPTAATDALNLRSADARYMLTSAGPFLPLSGAATMNGTLDMGSHLITNMQAPQTALGAANRAYVDSSLTPYAPLASPAFTGSPSLPAGTTGVTAAPGDADTSIATTAFVAAALGGVPGGAVIGDVAPTAQPGALWWDSVGGNLYVRYNDPDSTAWVAATNMTGLANAATKDDVGSSLQNVGRNKLHNSMFNVAQRGAGPFTAAGYTLDRWQMGFSGGTFSVSQIIQNDAGRTQIGDETCNFALNGACAGAALTGDYAQIIQSVEDVRRLAGKAVTVSFWAAAATAGLKIGVGINQFFGTGGSPSAAVQVAGQSVTLGTTWARYSVTFALASVIGKTLGTNNDNKTNIEFWWSAGATFAARSGNIGIQSGAALLWGVQLEIAQPGQTQPTPLEKLDPVMQLQQCQRFYQTCGFDINVYQLAANSFGIGTALRATMRATPTVTTNSITYSNSSGLVATAWDAGSINLGATATATGAARVYGYYAASADL